MRRLVTVSLLSSWIGCSTPPASADVVSDVSRDGDDAHSVDASITDAPEDSLDATSVDTTPGDGAAPACAVCDEFTTPAPGGAISNAALTEISGVVASHAHPGVLYVHNDSGDTPRFFAIDTAGNTLGEFRLAGANAVDWEDISLGPCPAGTCVYLGDVGDNPSTRAQYQVYRVAEPDVAVGRDLGVATVSFERLPFVYPNGSHNCETLMVHRSTGRVYVITKVADGMSEVFRFPMPLTPDTEVTLERVAGITLPPEANLTTTGGDIHPCANRFLLRVYGRLYEYRIDDARPFDDVFGAAAVVVPVASELQGEAVGYRTDGRGYFTVGEGAMRQVFANDCR